MKRSSSTSHPKYSSLVLQGKINNFRQRYNKSQQKSKVQSPYKINLTYKKPSSKSNLHEQDSTSKKQIKKSSSIKNISARLSGSGLCNPEKEIDPLEIKKSILLSGLDGQAKQLTGYAMQNHELVLRKKRLQQLIKSLKQRTAKQRRLLIQSNIQCGVLTNKIELTQQRLKQKVMLNSDIQQNISKANTSFYDLRRLLNQNNSQSEYNNKLIEEITNQNNNLQLEVSNNRVRLIRQDQQRLINKQKLIKQLKVLDNDVILYNELVSEKENLQKTIDKVVGEYKIQNPMNQRLLINSRKTQ